MASLDKFEARKRMRREADWTQAPGQPAPDVTAGSTVTILAPGGRSIESTTLTFASQDPAENEVTYEFSTTVPSESEYGVEIPGSAPNGLAFGCREMSDRVATR